MLEYVETYMDINELSGKEKLLSAGQIMLDHGDKQLANFARQGYILEAFEKLLDDDMSLEEFMQMGDVSSEHKIHKNTLFLEAPQQVLTACELDDDIYRDSLIVFEEDIVASFAKKDDLKSLLEERESLFVMI